MEMSKHDVAETYRTAIAVARALDIDDYEGASALFNNSPQDEVVFAAMQIIAALVARVAITEERTIDESWQLLLDALEIEEYGD